MGGIVEDGRDLGKAVPPRFGRKHRVNVAFAFEWQGESTAKSTSISIAEGLFSGTRTHPSSRKMKKSYFFLLYIKSQIKNAQIN